MKNLKTLTIGLFIMSLGLISCEKEENIAVDQELMKATAIVDFTNEIDFNAGVDISNENSSYSNRVSSNNVISSLASCASVSLNNTTPGVFPKVFTIDFGSGCTQNGITRSGSITITLTNYLMNSGSIMTIQRGSNYYVNGNKVEGTVVYENITANTNTPQWTRTISNGKITTILGDVFNHNGTRTVKQISGVSTVPLIDNIYEISSGNHTVSKVGGSSLTATVTEPLIKKYTCNHVSQGKLTLIGTILNGVLDYGDNTCDNLATYTHSNGNVFNIVLN
jgi:hypothetical protein